LWPPQRKHAYHGTASVHSCCSSMHEVLRVDDGVEGAFDLSRQLPSLRPLLLVLLRKGCHSHTATKHKQQQHRR
jgi:hypothetical protein